MHHTDAGDVDRLPGHVIRGVAGQKRGDLRHVLGTPDAPDRSRGPDLLAALLALVQIHRAVGQMALTVIPAEASSCASDWVNPMIPNPVIIATLLSSRPIVRVCSRHSAS